MQEELKELRDKERRELERIAQLTTGEAHRQILEQSEAEVRHELAGRVRQIEEEAASEAKRRARNLVADALQRSWPARPRRPRSRSSSCRPTT